MLVQQEAQICRGAVGGAGGTDRQEHTDEYRRTGQRGPLGFLLMAELSGDSIADRAAYPTPRNKGGLSNHALPRR